MTDSFFSLGPQDRREALEFARARSGRPAHLLEKDLWVVWALQTLFDSALSTDLTFKGGTTLSKVYRVIDRFSEDIDLTCDIRRLLPDLMGAGTELPTTRSQASRWTQAIRQRLPAWIADQVQPVIQAALEKDRLDAHLERGGSGNDKLLIHYAALTNGNGYVAPIVALEFGGRATGEPHERFPVTCDLAVHLPELSFPSAAPRVMSVSRTFWEKATAAHVFCAQGRMRSERFARHWHDLAAIARSTHFDTVLDDTSIAATVARHKACFFSEKDAAGNIIDYQAAVDGRLKIVPESQARRALAQDYAAMLADEVMVGEALSFDDLMAACADLEHTINETRRSAAQPSQ